MKRKYITFRPVYFNNWEGKYTISYFNKQQFADYVEAWITKIVDTIIPEERYIFEIAPWIKSLRRFAILECIDSVDIDSFLQNVMSIWSNFAIEAFDTIEDAKVWIRTSTNLVEESDGKFIINEWDEYSDKLYLEII